ncbi:MAG: hypothetical protein FRX49_09055 [Trebouxia sp. A1-2]|nr:MAG: hypothetical protein FRX49_09055 [Trebouxia sp. A1-2]
MEVECLRAATSAEPLTGARGRQVWLGITFDSLLVNHLHEEALLVHISAVYPVLGCALVQQPGTLIGTCNSHICISNCARGKLGGNGEGVWVRRGTGCFIRQSQVPEELLRPNSVDEAFGQVRQHTQLLIHVLHLEHGGFCLLTCTWAAGCRLNSGFGNAILTILDRFGKRVMEVCSVPQQRIACQGDAPLGLHTGDGCKPLGGWVLDLVTLISNHHSSLIDKRLKGLACSNSLGQKQTAEYVVEFLDPVVDYIAGDQQQGPLVWVECDTCPLVGLQLGRHASSHHHLQKKKETIIKGASYGGRASPANPKRVPPLILSFLSSSIHIVVTVTKSCYVLQQNSSVSDQSDASLNRCGAGLLLHLRLFPLGDLAPATIPFIGPAVSSAMRFLRARVGFTFSSFLVFLNGRVGWRARSFGAKIITPSFGPQRAALCNDGTVCTPKKYDGGK